MSHDLPRRIACLSAEAVEILYRLDCADRIVGVTAFAIEPPAARRKPRVGGFSSVNYRKIDALKPDLVITFSDVQAEAARELIRRGHTVLATNPRSLDEILETILLLGRVVNQPAKARRLVDRMRKAFSGPSSAKAARPRVYFEEWNDPFITGIRWVSELIEAAGGCDVFAELRDRRRAPDRVVTADEIIRRAPDVIVASWCGRKANLASIAARRGWSDVPAVRHGRVHEIPSAHILQPGPVLLKGFQQLQRFIQSVNGTAR